MHSGTVPNLGQVRIQMQEQMDPLHRPEIKGTTDSEHIFHFPICGDPHAHDCPKTSHEAVEIASKPVTWGEVWYEVPNDMGFLVADDCRFDMEPLGYGHVLG